MTATAKAARPIYSQGDVQYQARGRTWVFNHPCGYEKRTAVPGGKTMADEVARRIDAGIRMARVHNPEAIIPHNVQRSCINALLHGTVNPLARVQPTLVSTQWLTVK